MDEALDPSRQIDAGDVARGVCRLLYHQDFASLTEVPLGNGRRADVFAVGRDGHVTLVEIKVSMADLRGDQKWPDYLGFCDSYYWAVPAGFPLDPFDDDWFMPERSGLIVADRFGAAIIRQPVIHRLPPARRKAETLRFARLAAQRLFVSTDPDAGLARTSF